MSTNVSNTVPYLRTTRTFPDDDIDKLSLELNKSYLDTAKCINERIIGIYPTNKPAITGEQWFLTTNKKQTLRQIYAFTTTADIEIGFKLSSIFSVSPKTCGVYNDSSNNYYGLIFGTSVAIAGQISFFLFVDGTSTRTDLIRFVLGGGAPALASGIIDLEWLSQT